jgi:two-component system cell cycle sensor histidine kinase/response regulator CckA
MKMSASKERLAILLADDEHSVRHFLSRLLQVKGYCVHQAADGEEAARLFRAHAENIGLLLTDLTMPRKDGVELARELTSLCPELPVVFMSGNYPQWRAKLGALPFPCLEKPLAPDALLRIVQSQLSDEGCELADRAESA